MSSPLIPLMGQQPTFTNPLQNVSQLLQARDLSSQIGLRNAQTQQASAQTNDIQQQAQQRQQQLQDQKTLQAALSDPAHPEYATAAGRGDYSFMNGKVQPSSQLAWTAQKQQILEQAAKTEGSQIENHQKTWAEAGKTLHGLQDLYDQAEKAVPGSGAMAVAGAYPDAAASLKQLPGMANVSLPPAISGTPQDLAMLAAHTNASQAFWDEAATRQKANVDIAKTSADTTKAQADAQAQQAEATIKNKQIANMSPGGLLPEEQVRSQQAAATLAHEQSVAAETARNNRERAGIAQFEAGTQAQRAAAETSLAQSAMGDREINQLTKPHQANVTAAQKQLQDLQESDQMLQTGDAVSQSLGVRKMIAAAAGGPGSGLRVTNDNVNGILHARGFAGDVEAFLQKFGSGNKLDAGQVAQSRQILSDLQSRLGQKLQISNDAINQIQNAPDRQGRILADQMGRQHLNALDTGGHAQPSDAVKNVLQNASPGIHTLSDGSKWMKSADGSISQQ